MNELLQNERIDQQNLSRQTNLFGTDGIRARVGTFPLTQDDVTKLGRAVGIWATHTYGAAPKLLIGHDTRESAGELLAAFSAGLLQSSCTLMNVGTLPTPAIIKLATLDESVDGAVIITASHNPYHDNGIKIIDRVMGKLSTADEEAITQLFYEELNLNAPTVGSLQQLIGAEHTYLAVLATYFPANFLAGKTIVLDCAHGATSIVAPAAFNNFGATVKVLNNAPDGRNINHACGAVHPEQVAAQVKEHNADIGFAFDGDGDRVVAVSKDGIIKDGDDILALLSQHPVYAHEAAICCTIMSNAGLAEFATSHGKELIRTPVGDKHVSAALKKNKLLLGGEQSGHILLADFLSSGDGIFAALRLCEVALHTQNWQLESFEHVAQLMINIPVQEKRDLVQPDIAAIIAAHTHQLDNGTLIVRYSGTENLLRVMIQHKDANHAKMVGESLVQDLKQVLK